MRNPEHQPSRSSTTSSTPGQGTSTQTQAPGPDSALPRLDAQPQRPFQFQQAHIIRQVGPTFAVGAVVRPGSAPITLPHVTGQNQHQEFLQRLNQLHQRGEALREANLRQLLAQQRGTLGSHGTVESANSQGSSGNLGNSEVGRSSSPTRQTSQTITREGTTQDGQHFSFRITFNEVVTHAGTTSRTPTGTASSGDAAGPRPLSAAEVQNIIQAADAARTAQVMANAIQRSTSEPPPANVVENLANHGFGNPIQPIQPGVTTPIIPALSRNTSHTVTPDPSARSPSQRNNAVFSSQYAEPSNQQNEQSTSQSATANQTTGLSSSQQASSEQRQSPQTYPEVYLLSSPTGPRAVLINNGPSDMYITSPPRVSQYTPSYYYRAPAFPYIVPAQTATPQIQVQPGQARVTIAVPGQAEVRIDTPALAQQPQPMAAQVFAPRNDEQEGLRRRPVAAQPVAAELPHPVPQLRNPHGNPGAVAVAVALWPHIWLVIRLLAFAWWFSYSNPSWERWLSLAIAALVVFAINTGILNGIINTAFHPVREQLEGLIPFADPNRQPEQGQNQNGQNGADPDPAQMAARLVAERRAANRNWLMHQWRRIERAGILFLASFAPGVTERHIQLLEQRERAERRAAEETRAAAERAARENRETQQQGQDQAPSSQTGNEQTTSGASAQQPAPQQQPLAQAQPQLVET